jgi:hypothetical protein
LGAQTDAQKWYTLPQHTCEKSVFVAQKWILGFVVDAHRSSHDDDRLILLGVLRETSALIQSDGFQRPATCLKIGRQGPRPFDSHVLEHESAHAQPPPEYGHIALVTLRISSHVDYLLRWDGLQVHQGVDNLRIFPYNEHAAQNWITVPEALVR